MVCNFSFMFLWPASLLQNRSMQRVMEHRKYIMILMILMWLNGKKLLLNSYIMILLKSEHSQHLLQGILFGNTILLISPRGIMLSAEVSLRDCCAY